MKTTNETEFKVVLYRTKSSVQVHMQNAPDHVNDAEGFLLKLNEHTISFKPGDKDDKKPWMSYAMSRKKGCDQFFVIQAEHCVNQITDAARSVPVEYVEDKSDGLWYVVHYIKPESATTPTTPTPPTPPTQSGDLKIKEEQADERKLTVVSRLSGMMGNTSVCIPAIYRGHKWTTEEFADLLKGKSVVVTVCAYDKESGAYKTDQMRKVEVILKKKKQNEEGKIEFVPTVEKYIGPEAAVTGSQDTTFMSFLKELRELIDKYVEVQ